jgi:hypothetical protein
MIDRKLFTLDQEKKFIALDGGRTKETKNKEKNEREREREKNGRNKCKG